MHLRRSVTFSRYNRCSDFNELKNRYTLIQEEGQRQLFMAVIYIYACEPFMHTVREPRFGVVWANSTEVIPRSHRKQCETTLDLCFTE